MTLVLIMRSRFLELLGWSSKAGFLGWKAGILGNSIAEMNV